MYKITQHFVKFIYKIMLITDQWETYAREISMLCSQWNLMTDRNHHKYIKPITSTPVTNIDV
jgi:hypothetical protein